MCLTPIFLVTIFFFFIVLLNKIILSLWVRLLATVLNFQPNRIGYAKHNITHERTFPKWDDLMILQKTPGMERKLEDWPLAQLIGRRPQTYLTKVATLARRKQVPREARVVVVSRNPKARLCHSLDPLPINYVFESEDNNPFVDVRSERKTLL